MDRRDGPDGAPRFEQLAARLAEVLGPESVRRGEPLAAHTVWRIGGPADLLATAGSPAALGQAVKLAWEHEVPCYVLGGGSNVLVSDAGVRGLVVLNRARKLHFEGHTVTAQSGAILSAVARQCADRGLAGLQWAAGIPGTVGGAVYGNAGAWGGDVASILVEGAVLEPGGAVSRWPAGRFEYGYRTSALKRAAPHSRPVILSATLGLQPGNREALRARMAEIQARRRATQPPGASCGSVFKNPPGDYAGRLIEAAGLKGARIGGAEISTVHANFLLNAGQATAADIRALIEQARDQVWARFGVALELEIELLGAWELSASAGLGIKP